jgi:hypothetical protein
MGNRERFLALVLGAIIVALGMFWTSAASADIIYNPPNIAFSDARNDFKASRPGTVVEGRYGPFTVPANGQLHNGLDFSAPAPCNNCYITDIVPQLIYDGDASNTTGTVANLNNNMMMHHFVLINPARQDAVCPSGLQGQLGERFFASGNERTHMHLPPQYGYYNPSGQNNWTLIYHLVNKGSVDKRVSIQIYYKYRPASDTTYPPPLEAKPLWLDIDGCGDSEYTIPTGYSDTTTSWVVPSTPSPINGKMIAIAGHLHDVDITGANPCDIHCPAEGGGIAVSAELVGGANSYYGPVPPNNPPPASLTGTTLCRSEGYYGTAWASGQWKGHLDTMSACGIQTDIPAGAQAEAYPAGAAYPTTGLPFSSGQTIKLHSEYSNGTGSQQTDVMGIMMAWYAPTNAATTGYPRPKGATPTRVALVPAYKQCLAAGQNRTHGAPLSFPSCAPPVQASSYLTVGTPDAPANLQAANMVGSASFIVVQGNAGTTADEADVKVLLNTTDVRNKSDLTDYAGQLKEVINLRITDRDSGPTELATVQDVPLSYVVPCTTTPSSSTVGSTCSVNTTADAVVPSTVKELRRSIWQLDKVNVYDGGADGQANTDPNTLFLTQGVFVP